MHHQQASVMTPSPTARGERLDSAQQQRAIVELPRSPPQADQYDDTHEHHLRSTATQSMPKPQNGCHGGANDREPHTTAKSTTPLATHIADIDSSHQQEAVRAPPTPTSQGECHGRVHEHQPRSIVAASRPSLQEWRQEGAHNLLPRAFVESPSPASRHQSCTTVASPGESTSAERSASSRSHEQSSSKRKTGRPRIRGNGKKVKLPGVKTRIRLANQTKLDMINHFRETNNMQQTLSHFCSSLSSDAKATTSKSIYLWRQQRRTLEERCTNAKTASERYSRPIGVATSLTPAAKQEILQWVNMLRSDGVPASNSMLRVKACAVAQEHGIAPFAGSAPWRRLFRKRHKLSIRARTRQGQVTPAAAAARAQEFGKEVAEKMKALKVTCVHNADQTAVLFEYLPRTTINEKGAKTIWVRCAGYEKRRVTAMLLGDSLGNKYPPFLVMKSPPASTHERSILNEAERHGFGNHVWREVKRIQAEHGIQIYANATAWWNSTLTLRFLEHNFGNREQKTVPVLLLLDDFAGHWTSEVREYARTINVYLLKVPPRFTSVCQPADVAWNRPFKAYLREMWTSDLAEQVLEHRGDMAPFKLKVADRSKLSSWIVKSWGLLSLTVIKNEFVGSSIPSESPQEIPTALMDTLLESSSVEDVVNSDDDMVDGEIAYDDESEGSSQE